MALTQVFKDQMLSTASGKASAIMSAPIPAQGNRAVLSVLVTNASASTTGTHTLQGSYDGHIWFDLSTVNLGAFGQANSASGDVIIEHAFVRVFSSITGTNVSLLFSAWIAWSNQ